ncbi:Cut9-interacting protein scn1 [Exophiala dermatitidis]
MTQTQNDTDAVWQIGVFDAHCHPTDVFSSVEDIAQMKARVLTVMATRSQDQDLVAEAAKKYPIKSREDLLEGSSTHVLPSFGWHPWFSHELYNDMDGENTSALSATEHYRSVLVPAPDDDEEFVDSLPKPRALRQFIEQAESRLKAFPYSIVGEVGLDRSFRLPEAWKEEPSSQNGGSEEEFTPGRRGGRGLSPYRVNLDHQKVVLKAQLELAAKLQRPVSVHSVQAHGLVFDLMQKMWKGHEKPSKAQRRKQKASSSSGQAVEDGDSKANSLPYPPRICMHSYSGPPDALKQFFSPSVPADIYFSFSSLINFSNPSAEKVTNVIKAVPDDRILVESDFHSAGKKMDEVLMEIILKICEIKEWSLEEGAKRFKENWVKFVFGERPSTP